MNITKAEAHILAVALDVAKYGIANDQPTRAQAKEVYKCLDQLHEKLSQHCEDERMVGRKSDRSFQGILNRYCFGNKYGLEEKLAREARKAKREANKQRNE